EIERHLAVFALVNELDGQPARQERHFAKTLAQYVELVVNRLENGLVGQKGNGRARALVLGILGDDLDVALRHAALVFLRIHLPVAAHTRFEPFRERIDRADADTVQPGRDLVAAAAKFAAG